MSKKFKRDEQSADDKIDNIVETNPEGIKMDKQMNINVPESNFNAGEIKVVDEPKERTKTFRAAEVVTGSSNSAVSVGGPSLSRAVVFGGGAGTEIGSDVSATTKADTSYRSGSRTGKRVDPITRKIDFNYPELFKTAIRQSKPLSETQDKQGYNGNYFNEHAITQKSSGGSPGDPEFERSVDGIAIDMAYFTEGQYNTSLDDYGEFAVQSYDAATSTYSQISDKKGNYMPQDLTVTFNSNGAVGLNFSEVDLANRNQDEAVVRLAGDSALRAVNQAEIDRLTMVSKAGNESDPSWSPLGDAIVSSSAVNQYIAELDAMAGDNIFMSERKVSEALAYAVNKSAKDGIRVTGPMAELVNGNIEGTYSSALHSISEANGRSYAFDTNAFKAGGAGLWLAINDSLPKYTTKGKLLTLPLSFKNALNTVKQNRDVFRMHETLFNDVRHSELFSTIDKGYDPLCPIVMTDKAALIHPVSLATTGNVTITTSTTIDQNKLSPVFTYHYENLRNKYNIPVRNFFVEGLLKYFQTYSARFIKELGSGAIDGVTGLYTLTIPIQSSATSLSLWDLIVCSATPFMVAARQQSLVDVIKYQNNFGYPYSGLIALKDIDSNEAFNYTFTDADSALISKIADPIDAIKVKMPEVFWSAECSAYDDEKLGNNHGFMASKTVLPHYFVQNQFEKNSDGLLRLSDDASTMAYPSTRNGCNLSDMDTIYGMTEEDYRLALDRMVVYPGYDRASLAITSGDDKGPHVFKSNWSTVGTNHYELEESLVYKYGLTTDGIPVLPYLASAESSDEYSRCLTILDVMKTPREIGLHFVVPAGVLTPVLNPNTSLPNYRDVNSGYLAVSGPGFNAIVYHTQGNTMENEILQDSSVNISRNASYANVYNVIQATPHNEIDDFGIVLSMSRGVKATATAHTFTLNGGSLDFVPFTTGAFDSANYSYNQDTGIYGMNESQATSVNNALNVVSLQKYYWARLQRIPFVVNPFDANASDMTYLDNKQKGNKYDIYDFMYFFGFCGFRASDYSELTFERNRQRIAQGMNYLQDPYMEKSLLLK